MLPWSCRPTCLVSIRSKLGVLNEIVSLLPELSTPTHLPSTQAADEGVVSEPSSRYLLAGERTCPVGLPQLNKIKFNMNNTINEDFFIETHPLIYDNQQLLEGSLG